MITRKLLLLCFLCITLALNAFSQNNRTNKTLTSKEYLEKSKRQRTHSKIVLGVGLTTIGGGLLISAGNNDDLDGSLATSFVGVPLIITGLIVSIISSPIMKASRKNAKLGLEAASSVRVDNATPYDLVEVSISPELDEKILLITSDKKHLVRSISILDTKGLLINQYMDINNTHFQLPVQQLTSGQYTLIIQFDQGPIARQLIIK